MTRVLHISEGEYLTFVSSATYDIKNNVGKYGEQIINNVEDSFIFEHMQPCELDYAIEILIRRYSNLSSIKIEELEIIYD